QELCSHGHAGLQPTLYEAILFVQNLDQLLPSDRRPNGSDGGELPSAVKQTGKARRCGHGFLSQLPQQQSRETEASGRGSIPPFWYRFVLTWLLLSWIAAAIVGLAEQDAVEPQVSKVAVFVEERRSRVATNTYLAVSSQAIKVNLKSKIHHLL
ncbi:hypothetical protein V2K50_26205, partial [Pseudomonas alliivorans]|nr:hypothetical protein [Pseudomonas alliivorans]